MLTLEIKEIKREINQEIRVVNANIRKIQKIVIFIGI